MARKWRELRTGEPTRVMRSVLLAHERLAAIAEEAGLGGADTVVHDLRRGEVRGVWEGAALVVVVDGIATL